MIGPSPNRIGGVSIHIYRLCALLKEEFIFDFVDEARGKAQGFFNLRSLNIITYFNKIRKADIIHIHSGVFILRLFHVLVARFCLRKNVVVSIHHDLNVEGYLKITRFLLSHCNCAILDSQEIYDSQYVVNTCCRYFMMPAFLPPPIDEEDELPLNTLEWIRNVKSIPSSVLMASSANGIKILNGADLYGIDMCIDVVKMLNEKNDKHQYYLILIVLNSERQQDILNQYRLKIKQQSPNNILLLTNPTSFVRIMQMSDVILRPTNTDGDSITIREALYFKKRVVASDCVERPMGTIVFKTRDIEDFCSKIQVSVCSKNESDIPEIDYKSFYLNCYNDGHV